MKWNYETFVIELSLPRYPSDDFIVYFSRL